MSSIFFQKISIDEFINNINLLITKAGGPVAFSRAVDVSYASVLHWSKGQNLPDGGTLLKIHEKCDVSIDWLLTGKHAKGLKCPHCGDWSDEIRRACADMKEILESDDETVITALQSNLAAFMQSIRKNKKIHIRERDQLKSPGHRPGKGSAVKSSAG